MLNVELGWIEMKKKKIMESIAWWSAEYDSLMVVFFRGKKAACTNHSVANRFLKYRKFYLEYDSPTECQ